MLIIIPSDLKPEVPQILRTPEGVACFDNLAIAHRKGTHMISGASGVLRQIGSSLQGDASGIYRMIAQRHHEQSALIASTTDYIVLRGETDQMVSRSDIAGRHVYNVSFRYFASFDSVGASRLIAEDSSDKEIYMHVTHGYTYQHRENLRGVRCNLQAFGGGGSSTVDQFEDHARLGPTIALLDSDMRIPSGELGNTARAARSKARLLSHDAICDVEILPAHELENMIPARILEECLTPHDDVQFRKRWLGVIGSAASNGSIDFRYLDLKVGISGVQYHNTRQRDESEYVRAAAMQLCPQAIEACTCHPRDTCSCVYLGGLGGVAVARAATKLATQTPQKIAECFFPASTSTSDLKALWSSLAKRLVSWGFAAIPART